MSRVADFSPRRRAQCVFPAGSNGEFNVPEDLSLVLRSGQGCRLQDTEGRTLLDFSMGWGSALVGHAQPEVLAAVARQLPRGFNFAHVSEASLELAERLVALSPACSQVRFCASGTEATMYCLRLARAFTGRPKVLKFEGAYHGANDTGVTSLFPLSPPDFPRADPSCHGVDAHINQSVLVAPFNDGETTHRILEQHRGDLAAVIVEPLQRCVPPVDGFLTALREWTAQWQIPLIFDEVVTGFRLAYGGAQEYYGVIPDLVAYGKALGGGFPLGAFGGREDIMACCREDRLGQPRYVWVASSAGGSPVAAAAALAVLELLQQPEVYPQLHALGRYFRGRLAERLQAHGVTARVIGDGPLAQIVFTEQPVRDYRTSRHQDAARGRQLMLRLFQRGIFLNPMGTKLYLSLAHGRDECDEFCRQLDAVLPELA